MSTQQRVQKVRSFIIGVLILALGLVVGFRFGRGENVPLLSQIANQIPAISQISRIENNQVPPDFSTVDFAQFWEVWRRLERDYVDPQELDAKKMVYGAIQGMTSALGDPYTLFLPPEEQKRSVEDLGGSFEGVGISLGYKNNTLAVMAPLKGMAAEKAGVQAGDYILHIKDESKNVDVDTTGMTLPEAVTLIRGKKGTTVTLTFFREGGTEEQKDLVRDTIIVPSVELTFVESGKNDGKKVAHLKLNQFGDRTNQEWNAAVTNILLEPNLRGLVLDLRNNPGGYLNDAIEISSEFIKDGIVVSQQSRTSKQEYRVTRSGKLLTTPTVVLINKGSASASEIVAGALRDRRRIKLVGENSFGKGTVQDAQSDLQGGAGLHVTIAKWLLPSGEWIHDTGLEPDVAAIDDPNTADVDEALDAALGAL